LSVHSATLSDDEADIWSALVSSLSVDHRIVGETDSWAPDWPVVGLVDHFALLEDSR